MRAMAHIRLKLSQDYILSVGGDSGGTHYKPQFYDGKYDPNNKITVLKMKRKLLTSNYIPNWILDRITVMRKIKLSGTVHMKKKAMVWIRTINGSRKSNPSRPDRLTAAIYTLTDTAIGENLLSSDGELIILLCAKS